MSSLSEAESRIRCARRYYRHLYGSATRVELCFSEDDYGYIVWPDAILEHDTAKKYFGIPVKCMQNHFSDGSPANIATCPKKNGSMGLSRSIRLHGNSTAFRRWTYQNHRHTPS